MCFCVLYGTVRVQWYIVSLFQAQNIWEQRKSSSDIAGTAKKHHAIMMETKVKITERVEGRQKGGRRHSFSQHELFRQQHDSQVQGQGDGTCDDVLLLPMLSMVILNEPGQVMEEMEELHSMWMQDQQGAPSLILVRNWILPAAAKNDPACHIEDQRSQRSHVPQPETQHSQIKINQTSK